MNELAKLVSQKVGIPEDKARMAVEVVLNYLKGKLPAPIASQIDSIVAGGGQTGNIAGDIGGLFGSKK